MFGFVSPVDGLKAHEAHFAYGQVKGWVQTKLSCVQQTYEFEGQK